MSNSSRPNQLPLFAPPSALGGPPFREALAEFTTFPYQRPPLAARNWGHPLHSLCSYPSKMKPGLANTLVRLFSSPGERVLDPFAGVGTVSFEACSAGRVGLASDLSPFAFSVATGKVNPPTEAEADATMDDLAKAIASGPNGSFDDEELEVAAYFHQDTWAEVLTARDYFLDRERNGRVSGGHWLVKSAVAHILHGNRPYALSRRSHGIIPIPPKGPAVYKSLLKSLREKVHRVRLDSLPATFVRGESFLAPAQDLPLDAGSIDAIITSPPFLGSTDFLRQNRLRLWFCGMSFAEQVANKRGSDFLEGQKDLEAYRGILAEFARILRPTGLIVVHLGVVRGRDMALELTPIATAAGLTRIGLVYEDAAHLETHGRTARGGTTQHQFLFLRRP